MCIFFINYSFDQIGKEQQEARLVLSMARASGIETTKPRHSQLHARRYI